MALIPELKVGGIFEFKGTLFYILSSKPARAIYIEVLFQANNNNNNYTQV